MDSRQASKTGWNFTNASTPEVINCGSLQRIADSCELMAKRNQELIDDRDRYKRWYEERGQRIDSRDRTIANLRGQVTKLKNKLQSESIHA